MRIAEVSCSVGSDGYFLYKKSALRGGEEVGENQESDRDN